MAGKGLLPVVMDMDVRWNMYLKLSTPEFSSLHTSATNFSDRELHCSAYLKDALVSNPIERDVRSVQQLPSLRTLDIFQDTMREEQMAPPILHESKPTYDSRASEQKMSHFAHRTVAPSNQNDSGNDMFVDLLQPTVPVAPKIGGRRGLSPLVEAALASSPPPGIDIRMDDELDGSFSIPPPENRSPVSAAGRRTETPIFVGGVDEHLKRFLGGDEEGNAAAQTELFELYRVFQRNRLKPLADSYTDFNEVLNIHQRTSKYVRKSAVYNINYKLKNIVNTYPHLLYFGGPEYFTLERLSKVPEVLIAPPNEDLRKIFQNVEVRRFAKSVKK